MKKSNLNKILVVGFLIFMMLGLFPSDHILLAQTETEYQFLAPLPCTGGPGCEEGELKTFDPAEESGDALGRYLNLMIKLFIGICAVLAVILIVVGGIEYMTSELISSKEHGKERIRNALFGLLLALGAYTILNTINPNLLKSDLNALTKVQIESDANDSVFQTYDPLTKKYPGGGVYGDKWDDSIGRVEPLPDYVTINGKQCTFIGEENCTSTRSLDTTKLREIQWGCKCPLVVTGATEFWLHGGKTGSTTHQLTSTTVDLRPTPELNKYLSGGKPLVKMKRYGPGGLYLYEGNHWHIGR